MAINLTSQNPNFFFLESQMKTQNGTATLNDQNEEQANYSEDDPNLGEF